jgi:hypothetical protein
VLANEPRQGGILAQQLSNARHLSAVHQREHRATVPGQQGEGRGPPLPIGSADRRAAVLRFDRVDVGATGYQQCRDIDGAGRRRRAAWWCT